MYPDYIRKIIQKKRNLGQTYRAISEEFNLSISTLQCLSHYKKKSHKKKIGRKTIIGKAESLSIKRYVAEKNLNGEKVNCRKIMTDTNISVSRRTLNNWLLRNEFKYEKEAQKVMLSKKHKSERVRIISSWIEQNLKWENTAFTDEKRFCLDGPDNW